MFEFIKNSLNTDSVASLIPIIRELITFSFVILSWLFGLRLVRYIILESQFDSSSNKIFKKKKSKVKNDFEFNFVKDEDTL